MPTQNKDLQPAAMQCLFAENYKSQSQVGKNGGVFVGTSKIQNGVAVFDGTSNCYINYPNGSPFKQATTQPFTMSFDFKTTDTTAGVGVWGSGYSGGGAGCFTIIANVVAGSMTAYIGAASGGYASTIGLSLNDGRWHRGVVTRNGANIYSYLDGAYVATTNIGATTTVYASSILSGTRAAGTAYWTGQLGRCLIAKGAWSTADVAADWNNSLFNYESKVVLNLPMLDKVGSAAPFTTSDLSGKGKNATLGDGTTSTTFPTKLTHTNGYSLDGTTDYFNCGNVGTIKSINFVIAPDNVTQSILDCDGGTHKITVSGGTISATGFSSPSIYVNGVLNETLKVGVKQAVTVSTATGFSASALIFGKEGANYYAGDVFDLMASPNEITPTQVRDYKLNKVK